MKRTANENLDILVEILKNYLIPKGERVTTQTELYKELDYIEKQIAALKTDVERRDKIIFDLCKVLSNLYAQQHKEDQ